MTEPEPTLNQCEPQLTALPDGVSAITIAAIIADLKKVATLHPDDYARRTCGAALALIDEICTILGRSQLCPMLGALQSYREAVRSVLDEERNSTGFDASRKRGFIMFQDPPPPGRTLEEEVVASLQAYVLDKCEGNKAKAAKVLGVGRQTLYYRMEKRSKLNGDTPPPEFIPKPEPL